MPSAERAARILESGQPPGPPIHRKPANGCAPEEDPEHVLPASADLWPQDARAVETLLADLFPDPSPQGHESARPRLNRAEQKRHEGILDAAARQAIRVILRKHTQNSLRFPQNLVHQFQKAFERAVVNQSDRLVLAAQVGPGTHKKLAQEAERRKTVRQALAKELQAARNRLGQLKAALSTTEQVIHQQALEYEKAERDRMAQNLRVMRTTYRTLRDRYTQLHQHISVPLDAHAWPAIPGPIISASHPSAVLPDVSGVYFLWVDSTIEYVGRAVRLSDRLRLGSHHILRKEHAISWVAIDPGSLAWAESYYIGVVRPPLNFGRNKPTGETLP